MVFLDTKKRHHLIFSRFQLELKLLKSVVKTVSGKILIFKKILRNMGKNIKSRNFTAESRSKRRGKGYREFYRNLGTLPEKSKPSVILVSAILAIMGKRTKRVREDDILMCVHANINGVFNNGSQESFPPLLQARAAFD